jgi:hypothetical protein
VSGRKNKKRLIGEVKIKGGIEEGDKIGQRRGIVISR